jgi:hypothetical protein
MEKADLSPLNLFSYFITTFSKSFVKKSNECLAVIAVLNGLTSLIVSALYCLPSQIRLGEAMLNFGIKERCMVTNDSGLTATSERTAAFQKAEAKTKQLSANPDYLKYMNIKPLKDQIAELEIEIEECKKKHGDGVMNSSDFVYKIEILAAQIDNLNRLLAKEIGGNKIMQDLISGLLLVITIPVSEEEIIEIKDRGYLLFRPGILEKACKSFGLPADDPESFESKCNDLDFTRIEQLYCDYINVALRNALDSMIAGTKAFKAAELQGVSDQALLEEARWTAIEAYAESTRTSMIEAIVQKDVDDICSRYKASIRMKFMKLAYGKTSTVAALLDYTLHFLKATKRWWEDGNQIIIMGDQQVWKLLIDMQQSLRGQHPELGHMLIFDGEWHKTAQGNLSAVTFLTAEAMGTCIMETRQKESTQVAADSWQEGDAAAEAGKDVLTREAFEFYVKKLFKDEKEEEEAPLSDESASTTSESKGEGKVSSDPADDAVPPPPINVFEREKKAFFAFFEDDTMIKLLEEKLMNLKEEDPFYRKAVQATGFLEYLKSLDADFIPFFLKLTAIYDMGIIGMRANNTELIREVALFFQQLYTFCNKSKYLALSYLMLAISVQLNKLEAKVFYAMRTGGTIEGHLKGLDELLEATLNLLVQTKFKSRPTDAINEIIVILQDLQLRLDKIRSLLTKERCDYLIHLTKKKKVRKSRAKSTSESARVFKKKTLFIDPPLHPYPTKMFFASWRRRRGIAISCNMRQRTNFFKVMLTAAISRKEMVGVAPELLEGGQTRLRRGFNLVAVEDEMYEKYATFETEKCKRHRQYMTHLRKSYAEFVMLGRTGKKKYPFWNPNVAKNGCSKEGRFLTASRVLLLKKALAMNNSKSQHTLKLVLKRQTNINRDFNGRLKGVPNALIKKGVNSKKGKKKNLEYQFSRLDPLNGFTHLVKSLLVPNPVRPTGMLDINTRQKSVTVEESIFFGNYQSKCKQCFMTGNDMLSKHNAFQNAKSFHDIGIKIWRYIQQVCETTGEIKELYVHFNDFATMDSHGNYFDSKLPCDVTIDSFKTHALLKDGKVELGTPTKLQNLM